MQTVQLVELKIIKQYRILYLKEKITGMYYVCTLGVQVRNMIMVLTLVHLESIQAMNINDENL